VLLLQIELKAFIKRRAERLSKQKDIDSDTESEVEVMIEEDLEEESVVAVEGVGAEQTEQKSEAEELPDKREMEPTMAGTKHKKEKSESSSKRSNREHIERKRRSDSETDEPKQRKLRKRKKSLVCFKLDLQPHQQITSKTILKMMNHFKDVRTQKCIVSTLTVKAHFFIASRERCLTRRVHQRSCTE